MLETYRHICQALMDKGFEVLSMHVVDPDLEEAESKMTEQEIYERDMGLLKKADCLIAEVSIASIGVGYEVCSALGLGIPVLCIHTNKANVSSMILGNTNDNMTIRQYNTQEEMERTVLEFTEAIGENR